jgi:hypothetical protein
MPVNTNEPSAVANLPGYPEPAMRRPMPPSVMFALAVSSVSVVKQVISGFKDGLDGLPSTLFSMAVGWAILSGYWNGHRLAWQWGRLLTLLYAIVFVGVIVPKVVAAGTLTPDLIQPVVASLVLIAAGLLLGSKAARNYFRLYCPNCGSGKVKAADFEFHQAKCKRCGRVW